MKATILFKDDHFVRPETLRKHRRLGANDNFRSLEFEMNDLERDWLLPCLFAAVFAGFAVLIFMPLW